MGVFAAMTKNGDWPLLFFSIILLVINGTALADHLKRVSRKIDLVTIFYSIGLLFLGLGVVLTVVLK
jgi:hypothetical protein